MTPGVLPVWATRALFKLLIRELLPTLGSPTTPASKEAAWILIYGSNFTRRRLFVRSTMPSLPQKTLLELHTSRLRSQHKSYLRRRNEELLTSNAVFKAAYKLIGKLPQRNWHRTNRDGCLNVRGTGVVLQQLQQRIGSKALAAGEAAVCRGGCWQPPLTQVGRLLLGGTLERHCGQLLAQVLQPGLCHLPWDKICRAQEWWSSPEITFHGQAMSG